MPVEAVRGILAQHRAELAEMGVASLKIFGSLARGEAGPESDVDLLVEFDRPIGLIGLADVAQRHGGAG